MAAFKSSLIALAALLSFTFSSAHRAHTLTPIVLRGPVPAGPVAVEPAPDSSPPPSRPTPAGPRTAEPVLSSPLTPVPVPAGPHMPVPVPAGPRTAVPVPAGPHMPVPVPAGPSPPKAAGPSGPSPSVPVSSVQRGAGDVEAESCGGCDGRRNPGCGGSCGGCKPPPVAKPYYCQPIKNCGGVGSGGGGFTIYLGGGQFAAPAVSGDHEIQA